MYLIIPVVFSAVVAEVADLRDGERALAGVFGTISLACLKAVCLSVRYLDRSPPSRLLGTLLGVVVSRMSRTLERRLPRSQDHLHSGPEPLSELILHPQMTVENDLIHAGLFLSVVSG